MAIYSMGFYKEEKDDVNQVMVMYPINSDASYIELIEGSIPILENEIAMSEKEMKKLNVNIGD